MKKTMKILFPTDFSEPAANAFVFTLLLADRWQAEIELLHVVYPQTEALDIPVMVTAATRDLVDVGREVISVFVKNAIAKVKDQLQKEPGITTNIEIGIPERTIEEIAKRDQVDLIIMGSRGENRSGIDRLIGSVAAVVVKNAACPVMVIPENSTFQEPAVVAYATDVKSGDPFEIWQSMELLKALKPVVHIVHVNLTEKDGIETWEKMEEMERFFEEKNYGSEIYFHHIHGTDLEKSLNEFVEAEQINFLVMYQPSRNFWNRLFHKSRTKSMAMHSKVPLIVQKD